MRHTEAWCKSACCQPVVSLLSDQRLSLAAGSGGSALGPSCMVELTACLVLVPNRPHADTVHGKLGVLSEQSVQKSLQLSSSRQNSQCGETTAGSKQRELEQLRRENQVHTFKVENTL